MESIEHEKFRSVHVMRHSFIASEQLVENTRSALEPATPLQKFVFYASKVAVFDRINFYDSRHTLEIEEIDETFQEHKAPIRLNGRMNFLPLSSDMVRMRFQALNQGAFNALVEGFDIEANLRPDLPVKEDGAPNNHYIYTDVPRALVPETKTAQKRAIRMFAAAVTTSVGKRLNYFSPDKVTGKDDVVLYRPEDDAKVAKSRRSYPWENDGIAS